MTGLPGTVRRPAYDRAAQKAGIVHFGVGAFHRAHQALYVDDAMCAGERGWGIIGVSLRSASVAEQMNPQDGLYTVVERSGDEARYRVVGAVQKVLVAARERDEVVAALASRDTHIVTFTITEKGYCRATDGSLDPSLAHEGSIFPLLMEGLARRRAAGLPGLTLLSCDNLAGNGAQLEHLLRTYLDSSDPALTGWVHKTCTFPSSMVDRIVPTTTEADLGDAHEALGISDAAHVRTEPFRQWVIEDRFAGPRPRLEAHGVEIVANVAPYETAKLRMLNGAHSALAYIGLAHGYEFVHQAVGDPAIRALVERLMRDEAAPSIVAAPGQDLSAYAQALLGRFANSALNHQLLQIAMDGSQKIPHRWLETLACGQEHGRHCPAILTGIAAWLLHIRGDVRPVDDPLAEKLAAIWRGQGPRGVLEGTLGSDGLLESDWRPSEADQETVARALDSLEKSLANPAPC